MRGNLVLLAAGAVLLLAATASAAVCTYSPHAGVTYDLSKLTLAKGFYDAPDNDGTKPYKYYWNVCAPLDKDSFATTIPAHNCDAVITAGAAAVQVANSTGEPEEPGLCVSLGQASASFFHNAESDAMAGVRITYQDGTECEDPFDPAHKIKRSFNVIYHCNQDTAPQHDHTPVTEPFLCEYSVSVQTKYACPLQCHHGASDSICSGHGICGINSDLAVPTAACFCNHGYAGHYCESLSTTETDTGRSATPALVGVTITLIVALVALVVLIVNRIKKLNTGDLNYSKMGDGAGSHPSPASAPRVGGGGAPAGMGSAPRPVGGAAAGRAPARAPVSIQDGDDVIVHPL